jgi:hypothetical protein
MDADRDRTLRIEIPPCTVQKAAEEPEWTDLTDASGWERLLVSPLVMYWKGSIDLSGYARDYKTFYPAGGVIQQGPYMAEAGGDGSVLYTIVSSVPIDPTELHFQLAFDNGPGFINNTVAAAAGVGTNQQNWETVMFAESQLYVPNLNITTTTGLQQLLERNQSGSLAPTAAQVLYVVKMLLPFGNAQTTLVIPASRVILPGTMDQEPELEYMMRLSRSVELANQV